MEDVLLLQLPVFRPQYDRRVKYGYKNAKGKSRLLDVLLKCTNGYCMYCYSRVLVDGKSYAHLEHAIEKNNSDKLTECIPNIGLACSVCNQTYKRIGENKRTLSKEVVRRFEQESLCVPASKKQCVEPCDALRNMQCEYSAQPDAHILLQPMGIRGLETGELLNLQYDVLNMEFQPAEGIHTYSENEKQFIESHIRRFRLNDPKYRTKSLFQFIRNVVDQGGIIPLYEYNNWIVEEFARKLNGKTRAEILKICEAVYRIMFLKQ